jgi:hypothetical protein
MNTRKFQFLTTLFCIFFIALSACHEEENVQLENDEYDGVFMRLTPDENAIESPVTLTLSNGQFTGTSDSLYYPAICSGRYAIEGKNITFTNECAWTANFDWTLILDGTYVIEQNGDKTLFIKELGNGTFNIYQFQ